MGFIVLVKMLPAQEALPCPSVLKFLGSLHPTVCATIQRGDVLDLGNRGPLPLEYPGQGDYELMR